MAEGLAFERHPETSSRSRDGGGALRKLEKVRGRILISLILRDTRGVQSEASWVNMVMHVLVRSLREISREMRLMLGVGTEEAVVEIDAEVDDDDDPVADDDDGLAGEVAALLNCPVARLSAGNRDSATISLDN